MRRHPAVPVLVPGWAPVHLVPTPMRVPVPVPVPGPRPGESAGVRRAASAARGRAPPGPGPARASDALASAPAVRDPSAAHPAQSRVSDPQPPCAGATMTNNYFRISHYRPIGDDSPASACGRCSSSSDDMPIRPTSAAPYGPLESTSWCSRSRASAGTSISPSIAGFPEHPEVPEIGNLVASDHDARPAAWQGYDDFQVFRTGTTLFLLRSGGPEN